MGDHERISAYYLGRLGQSGETHEVLGWESAEAQESRFSVLLHLLPKGAVSILDVGSGLGDLFAFLQQHEISARYTGVDILPEMIDRARRRFPEARFECVDILSDEGWEEAFDVVYASGIFNLRMEDNMRFVKRAAERFAELTTGLCVANFLSESSENKEAPYFYYSQGAIDALFSASFPEVRIVDGYLRNDFTVVARKRGDSS
jgi:SAM-dependent methyltransferase